MTADTAPLILQADRATRAGDWREAERLWREVLRREPQNPRAAFSLGVHALQGGNFSEAAELVRQALSHGPPDPFVLLTLSRALRGAGDEAGEAQAIDAALAIDPYFVPAMLAKGQRYERMGAAPSAAMFYRNAVKVSGPESGWPDMLRPQLQHAQAYAARLAGQLHQKLEAAIAPLLASVGDQGGRWREAASVIAGLSEPYVQHANQIHVPRLPAIPFYDRSLFPWARELESRTAAIRDELRAALSSEGKDFTPYINIRAGQPVDQWQALNQSQRWSHYSLWKHGTPDAAHLNRCPETRKALEAVDMAEIAGLCPNAMFSALAPRTEIPPHTGETNARLVVHLPLIVPEKCTYRVGFEHRVWKEGEILVFDDTIEHAARNDSDQLRVVLIFDVWNPLLAMEEREVVRALAAATRAFNTAG